MLAAIVVSCLFMATGPTLILINQYILRSLNFPYPMFLSGLGVLSSGLFAQILVRSKILKLEKSEHVEGKLWYKRVLPVGLAHATTLAFGNAVYLYLNVGFIQMLKSFTPVVLLVIGVIAKITPVTFPTFMSVLVITFGTVVSCSFSPEMNLFGILIMLLAEIAEGFRLVFTQYFLHQLKFSVTESQYYLAPASAFWLFLTSALYELPVMIEKNALVIIFDNIGYFILAATTGIMVNYMSYFVIQYTSSLTMKILGTLRNIVLIFIGVIFYSEQITVNEALGYIIALIGFILYNMAQMSYLDQYNDICASCFHSSKDVGNVKFKTSGSYSQIPVPISENADKC